jgi:hypothetical protein
MKKLRLIVTSVIVLAIVGSAFSFKIKAGAFCVVDNGASNNCTTHQGGLRITTSILAPRFKYFPAWDGNSAVCTAPNNNLCTALFRLTND